GPPGLTPCATPKLLMRAVAGADDAQVTAPLTLRTLLSLKVPSAVKGASFPCEMVALLGVIAIEAKPAFNPVEPLTPFKLAVITVLPNDAPTVASPPDEVILATAGTEDFHDTSDVTSFGGP